MDEKSQESMGETNRIQMVFIRVVYVLYVFLKTLRKEIFESIVEKGEKEENTCYQQFIL